VHDGEPVLALGSPGGSTIITTVLQILVNRIDRNMNLLEAIAAPRASQRNRPTADAEPAFIDAYGAELGALGHEFTPLAEIGAATGIEFLPGGLLLAAAEPSRRGGGSAGVLHSVLGTAQSPGTEDSTPAPELGEDG
jgi:gamma-glutamyltranspeptidase/glutathione hydrolase